MFDNIKIAGPEFSLLFTLFVPLAGAFLAAAIKKALLRNIVTIFVSVTLFICVVNLFLMAVRAKGLPPIILGKIIPEAELMFFVDPLGMMFSIIASFLWVVTSIYSISYMKANKELHQGRFFAFFALAIFATNALAFAGNLFTLFIFYEVLTLSTFPLVTHHGSVAAKRSGRVYLGLLLGTSLFFFLPAIIWTYNLAGTTEFKVGGILTGKADAVTTGFLLFLFVYGVGKSALMPLHKWLPAAMIAPTPVSALLHAVAVVKAGVFTIVKIIIYIFGANNLSELINLNWLAGEWLVYLAGLTIVVASVIALRQDNLKLRLAYSTISQLSYVILAVSLLTPKAVLAAVFHIVAHAVSKITLFFAAGAIYTASHKKYVSELSGIGKKMPFTMSAFTIAAISMIGLPPAAGFLSKYYLMRGNFDSAVFSTGTQLFVIAAIIASTLLNAAYFLPIIFSAFLGVEKDRAGGMKEAPAMMVFAMSITAILTIILFIMPNFFLWFGDQVSITGQYEESH